MESKTMETALVEPGESRVAGVARGDAVMREVCGGGGGGGDRARLLVVDDVEENRQVLGRILVRHGFAVDVARDGLEALSMLGLQAESLHHDDGGRDGCTTTKADYDAVLLDVMMPEISGYDVLKTIRRTRSAAELPVIMATVMDSSEEIVKALGMGANDYVTKPLDFSVVLARVKTQVALVRMVRQIRELEAGLAERNLLLKSANERMTADLEAAARVQQALLPVAPPVAPGYGFAWSFEPSATLAGDLLNVFRLDDRRVGFFVLDVSGHGVAASLLSVTVSRFLSATADASSMLWRQTEGGAGYELESPARVADRLNRRFPFDDGTNQFVTMVYGILDVQSHEVRYVSAGHPDLLLVSPEGNCRKVEGGGCPIGVSGEAYQEMVLRLGEGERVYVYSDGIPEARNSAGEQMGASRMLKVLCDARGRGLAESVELVRAAAREWSGGGTPGDDRTVLAIERVM